MRILVGTVLLLVVAVVGMTHGCVLEERVYVDQLAQGSSNSKALTEEQMAECYGLRRDMEFCKTLERDIDYSNGIQVEWLHYNGTLTMESSVKSVLGTCTIGEMGCGLDSACVNTRIMALSDSQSLREWDIYCSGSAFEDDSADDSSNSNSKSLTKEDMAECYELRGDMEFCKSLDLDVDFSHGISVVWLKFYNMTYTLESAVKSILGTCSIGEMGCGLDDIECIDYRIMDLSDATSLRMWDEYCANGY